jgi:toxic protein SymE
MQLYGTTARPRLLLCGFWLFQAGFEVGSKVKVSIENGCLTIKPVTTSNQ